MELETLDTTDSTIRMINELLTGTDYQIEDLCRSEMVEFDRSSDLARAMTELTKKEPIFMMVHSEADKIGQGNHKIVICGPGTVANALSDQEFVTLRELEGTYEAILNLIDGSAPKRG
jgi:acetylornithine deacetylase/succinyl-diaminopimelate desuccinylase-like protein